MCKCAGAEGQYYPDYCGKDAGYHGAGYAFEVGCGVVGRRAGAYCGWDCEETGGAEDGAAG